MKLKDLTPDTRNANKGTPRGQQMIEDSLRNYGAGRSILIDKHGRIIAGNKTAENAGSIGMEDVILVQSDGTKLVAVQRMDLDLETDKAAKELAVADNRSGQVSLEWDGGVLQDLDIDLSKFWTEDELKAVFAEMVPAELLTDEDAVPEVPEEPKTKLGDLYVLGNHRLLCGDSTAITDVERLMDGEKADICFTSPPYGQQRDYETGIADWFQLMTGVFDILPIKESAQVLVNLGLIHRDGEWMPYWDGWIEHMRASGWRRFGWYVWDQGHGLTGDWNGRLAPSHEFVFHFNKSSKHLNKTVECKRAGDITKPTGLRRKDGSISGWSHGDAPVQDTKIPDSVIRIGRHMARGIECEHPAVFPVALVSEIVTAFSNSGDLLYEPFCGSGTQMIAAEKEGRICYGMELAPKYCDVIVTRWENATGKKAVLYGT